MKAGDDSTESERRGLKKLRASFGPVVSAALNDPPWRPGPPSGNPPFVIELSPTVVRLEWASGGRVVREIIEVWALASGIDRPRKIVRL